MYSVTVSGKSFWDVIHSMQEFIDTHFESIGEETREQKTNTDRNPVDIGASHPNGAESDTQPDLPFQADQESKQEGSSDTSESAAPTPRHAAAPKPARGKKAVHEEGKADTHVKAEAKTKSSQAQRPATLGVSQVLDTFRAVHLAHGTEMCREMLKKHGLTRISELTPNQYESFMKACEKLLSEGVA